ncbi:MAG: hypothetical protein KDD06_17175, partial [Phaeodactylibacter sp.]|nr:hypothetical protein [Phaeodactylibacter sp.]
MPFKITPNVKLRKDKEGRVRQIQHLQEPYLPESNFAAASPLALSASYVEGAAPIFEVPPEALGHLQEGPLEKPDLQLGNELRVAGEKRTLGTTTIEYVQTHHGLPIWHSGVAVSVHHDPMRVSSSVSTLKYGVEVEILSKEDPIGFASEKKKLSSGELADMLGIKAEDFKGGKKEKERLAQPRINGVRLIIYRYDP